MKSIHWVFGARIRRRDRACRPQRTGRVHWKALPIPGPTALLVLICCLFGSCKQKSHHASLTWEQRNGKTNGAFIGAYYYPWYWKSRWTEQPIANTPVLGHYESTDRTVVRQHIKWAKEADVDFFIMSWLNTDGRENAILKKTVLPELEKADYRFIILYETRLALTWPYDKAVNLDRRLANATKAGDTLIEQFEYMAHTYFSSPSYLRVNGRPVVILYAMGDMTNSAPYFRNLKQRMSKRGVDLHMIADMVYWDPLERNDWPMLKENFEAVTAYNLWYRPNFLTVASNRFRLADDLARANGLRFIPNVMPGYDDTRLRGLGRPVFERMDTRFYRDYWTMSSSFVDRQQPFLFITSFNEWHEGSELEPSKEYRRPISKHDP